MGAATRRTSRRRPSRSARSSIRSRHCRRARPRPRTSRRSSPRFATRSRRTSRQIEQTDAPDELSSQKDQLSNRLLSLRTQLSRVQGLLAAGDLESAQAATEQLLSIQELRQTIAVIEAASGGGTGTGTG